MGGEGGGAKGWEGGMKNLYAKEEKVLSFSSDVGHITFTLNASSAYRNCTLLTVFLFICVFVLATVQEGERRQLKKSPAIGKKRLFNH